MREEPGRYETRRDQFGNKLAVAAKNSTGAIFLKDSY